MKRILSIIAISLLTFTAGCSLNQKGASEHSSLEKQNSLLKENSRLKAKQALLKSDTQTSKANSQSSTTQASNTKSTNSDNSNADQASQDSRPADIPSNYKIYSSYTTDGHKMIEWGDDDQVSYEGDPDAQYQTDIKMQQAPQR